jgi:antirestriction protein ArdC
MPMPGQFESDDAYQSTFYHECIHSTGHSKRLDRDLTGAFGHEDYAKEELVAELGSIFLCAQLGVTYDISQHASYIKSWQKAIKSNPRYITTAAKDAQKAFEYCMSQFELMRKYDNEAA